MKCHLCDEDHISEDTNGNPVCKKHWFKFLRGQGYYDDATTEADDSGVTEDTEPEAPTDLETINAETPATDAARALADENGLDLREIDGTGSRPEGAVLVGDVREAL